MLTDIKVRNAKPRDKPYKLADGGGLSLLVTPGGGRYWHLKYRVFGRRKRDGKEKMLEKVLTLGVYPEVPLAGYKDKTTKEWVDGARELRERARRELKGGKDPGAEKQQKKRVEKLAAGSTFKAVAEEWLKKWSTKWSEGHAEQIEQSLEFNVYPEIGDRPIAEIEPPDVLALLRKVEERGAHEVRQKVQQRIGAVFRYGIATGRCKRDQTSDLKGAFAAPKVKHYAYLTADQLPDYLTKLATYDGLPVTKIALRILALTFVRTGELRGAEWSEFDLKGAEWRIPAERMKMGDAHIVPLSRQSVAALKELHALTGAGKYAFPHRDKATKCMSENTVLYALYRMGYHGTATGHGFRATASTILNEKLRFPPDVIERQLAHLERNKIRAAYNHAQYLPERRKMMQAWANLLDEYAEPRKVIAGKFGAKR